MAKKSGGPWGCLTLIIVLAVVVGVWQGVSAIVNHYRWASVTNTELVQRLTDADLSVHAKASKLLADRGQAGVDALTAALSSPKAEVRIAAAKTLGELDAGQAGTRLIVLLKDPQPDVRRAAAEALGALGVKAAAKPLTRLLKDKAFAVRETAADALVALGDASVAPLTKSLGVHSGDFKWVAADIIVRIAKKDPQAAQSLRDLLKTGSVRGVANCYAFFIRLGKPGSEKLLRKALMAHGSVSMAEDYLNCGNSQLESAAETWASNHGYAVNTRTGSSGGPTWGSASE